MGVNSLGIGSGVLTADVLDQLRAADDSIIIKPIESKLELANQKEDANKLLSGFMNTFKSSTASLGGENLYLGREVSGNDDFVTVSVKAGADLQSFNITDVIKAEKDVWNATSSFDSTSTAISGLGSGTMTITVGGKELQIDYNSSTTLEDIKTAINDSAAVDVTATNLKIGESSYSFSVSSNNLNEAITFSDSQQGHDKQLDTIALTGDAASGDTFTWSDGVNSLVIPLVAGETAEQTGATIAAAITADPILSGLYTATGTTGGFTMESNVAGVQFTGSSSVSGAQLAIEATTFAGFTKQLDAIALTGNAVTGDTFEWSDGINSLTINLVNGETPDQTGVRIADAINADPTLSGLYTATATTGGFTMESQTFGLDFTGTATSTGTQTSASTVTTEAKTSLANKLNLNNIQAAREASFKMNGIAITRSTNTIDDLINGATITLNKTQNADTTSITIGQNDLSIKTEMDLFVTNFNLLTSNLKDMTVYDQETSVAGIFNSESSIKSIAGDLTKIITKTDLQGKSLFDYGINIDRSGVMTLDSSKLSAKLAEDPSALELLFRGKSETVAFGETPASAAVIGLFQELDTKMYSYTGSGKFLSNFTTQLSKSKTSLISEYDKQKATLDARYETMTKKFAAYDSIINKLNSQFSSLKMLIDAQSNTSNN